MNKKKVGIIGGGIIGTSIAYHLSQHRDVEVVVFEKNSIGSGTTAKSAGTVCLIDDSVPNKYFPERLFGLEAYLKLEKEEKGCTGYHNCGTIVVCPDKAFEDYVKVAVRQTIEAGYRATYHTGPKEIGKIVPDLNLDGILGAGYTPDDGYFDATAISNTYAKKARAQGAKFLIGANVTRIHTQGGRVTGVETTRGKEELDIVINAAGPWARFVGRLVDMELPLWHTKAEVFILEPTPPLSYKVPILKYPKFYTRPEKENIFICKSHVGLDLTNKNDAGIFDPDSLPMRGGTESYFWDFLTDQLMQYYPRLLESRVVNDWVGYRCVTKDFLPILGETRVQGFMVATGPSGNGVIEAPAIGKALEEFIVRGNKISFGSNEPLLDLWRPDRFPEDKTPS